MFDIGLPEFFVLGVIALLVFGPERLPEVALQAARMIKRLRTMAESARTDLTADLEPHMRELRELRELDPRKLAKKYVLDPSDEDGTLKGLAAEARSTGKAKPKTARPVVAPKPAPVEIGGAAAAGTAAAAAPLTDGPALPPAMAPSVTPVGEKPPFDPDAT